MVSLRHHFRKIDFVYNKFIEVEFLISDQDKSCQDV